MNDAEEELATASSVFDRIEYLTGLIETTQSPVNYNKSMQDRGEAIISRLVNLLNKEEEF